MANLKVKCKFLKMFVKAKTDELDTICIQKLRKLKFKNSFDY